jgi:hypothetical protein
MLEPADKELNKTVNVEIVKK